MRQRSNNVHAKVNEALIGTFKGIEQEKAVKINDQTGMIRYVEFDGPSLLQINPRDFCDCLHST